MVVSFPGAGCDPGMVGVVDCKALGDRGDEDLLSAVGDADKIEPVVKRDLACPSDPARLKGCWFRGLTWGSLRSCRRRFASER